MMSLALMTISVMMRLFYKPAEVIRIITKTGLNIEMKEFLPSKSEKIAEDIFNESPILEKLTHLHSVVFSHIALQL